MEEQQTETEKKTKREYQTSVINRNKIKEEIKGFKITKPYLDKLERQVNQMIRESMIRATGNRRSTLLPRDL